MSESEPRNWADLPGELLNLIYKKLSLDPIYPVRFRSVCKNWRSSAAPFSHPTPHLPWLIECENPTRNSYLQPTLRFYSLAGGVAGTISVPEPYRGMKYNGPGHGYLLVSSSDDQPNLLNPLTSNEIILPKIDGDLTIRSPACSASDPIQNWHLVSCFMPDSHMGTWTSLIYHLDNYTWTNVDIPFCHASCNTCCWDGKLFATEEGCCTRVFDVVTGNTLYEVPKLEDEECQVLTTYLVESCEEILRVSWYFVSYENDEVSDENDEVEVSMFDIYKLHSEGGKHFWVEVSDIGDQVVFLDLINGFSMKAPAGFKGNCIYFLLDDGKTPCRYDIDNRTMERVPCPFKSCTWFIPHLG
jgi:Protein of unknown function (DUF295)